MANMAEVSMVLVCTSGLGGKGYICIVAVSHTAGNSLSFV